MRHLSTVIILLLALCGCNKSKEIEKLEAMRNIITRNALSMPDSVEFLRLYPGALSSFIFDKNRSDEGVMQLEGYIYDRYIVRLQTEIWFDKQNLSITKSAFGIFVLEEVREVETENGGNVSIKHGEYFRIGKDDWHKLCKANGDFSKIGIGLMTNSPVRSFDKVRDTKGQ